MVKYRIKGMVSSWCREILKHKLLLSFSILLLILSTVANYYSGTYVTEAGSGVVADLLLDYLPVVNLFIVFVYGYIVVMGLLFFYPMFFDVKKLHEVISQFSLLVMLRSFFILFTHLKTPLEAIPINFPWIILL